MSWFSRKTDAERQAEEELKEHIVLENNKKMLGKTIVAAKTITVAYVTRGTVFNVPMVKEAASVSGICTATGKNSIKIENEWYELDHTALGGIRIIDVI